MSEETVEVGEQQAMTPEQVAQCAHIAVLTAGSTAYVYAGGDHASVAARARGGEHEKTLAGLETSIEWVSPADFGEAHRRLRQQYGDDAVTIVA